MNTTHAAYRRWIYDQFKWLDGLAELLQSEAQALTQLQVQSELVTERAADSGQRN